MEAPVPGEADPAGCLDSKEAASFDCEIQRISGVLKRSLSHAETVAAQQSIAGHHSSNLRFLALLPEDDGSKVVTFRTITRRLRVRQIGRGRIERLRTSYQPRKRRIVSTIHLDPPARREREQLNGRGGCYSIRRRSDKFYRWQSEAHYN